MIKTKEDLKFFLQEDAKSNGIYSFRKYIIGLIANNDNAHSYRYLKALRHCEYHYNNIGLYHKIAFVYYRIKLGRLGVKYHLDIPLNITGYGLRLLHIRQGGVILNAAKIGNYCGFNAGSLIGNNKSPENKPTIGDYVHFGPGAKAFGKVSIGNHVFVAPNSVVASHDVPDNCIVGGVPAKIISKKIS